MNLTPSQREILRLLCLGLAYKQIAHTLGIVGRAVDAQLYRARKANSCPTTFRLIHLYTLENPCQPFLPMPSPAGPTTEPSTSNSPDPENQ